MREFLSQKYKELRELCNIEDSMAGQAAVNSIIKKSIAEFTEQCNIPAIWCYGKHTKMLMADFIFELKKVRYIIDRGIDNRADSGFEIIKEEEILEKQIDGVIISSREYKDEIIEGLKTRYPNVRYLDIYEELEKAGIHLELSYYALDHPYIKYGNLNKLQRSLLQEKDAVTSQEIIKKIIQAYVVMKDFASAIVFTKKLIELSVDAWSKKLLEQLVEIYEQQKQAFESINENNVLMLCVDGLRRREVTEKYMKNLTQFLQDETYYFCNAYSVSTSTFESLIPAYSENIDLRTKYYEMNKVPENKCRFINEAKKQKRKVVFYTDGMDYVEDETIIMKSSSQTATEKLWEFMIDAIDEKNGLFYVHIGSESHFSYSNPYTTDELVAKGMHIFYDFLEKNGGKLETDYDIQQKDALRYLDERIIPLISRLCCRMVLFADHGNIVFGKETDIGSIEGTKYTFHEELIQVPLAIKSPEMQAYKECSLISLMELNNMIIGLMNQQKICYEHKEYIKIVRSEIYNPDFRYLYKKTGNEHGLLAFEVFIFDNGYKLAIYADGMVELYLTETDCEVQDQCIKKRLLDIVKEKVTVCGIEKLYLA